MEGPRHSPIKPLSSPPGAPLTALQRHWDRRPRGAPVRYGIAVLASAVALGVAMCVQRPVLELAPLLLFYGAVAVSAAYGGTGPGLLAAVLGALAADHFLLAPPRTFFGRDLEDLGRLLPFLLVGTLIAWLNGALHAANARCEREAAAARLNEARVRRLAGANLVGVFFCDLDGNVSDGNDEFLRLVGCTREELHAGKINWLALTAPEHRHRDADAVEEVKRCRVCTPFEKEHVLRDGRRIPVLMGCAMLDEPDLECVGFVLDLTELKRAEELVREHEGRLQALASELMLAEEGERRRIACVLHDSIGQNLALAKLRLGAVASSEAGRPLAGPLAVVSDLLAGAIERTRTLTSDISPPVLYELGLEAAVRWLGERFGEEQGLAVTVEDDRQPKPLDDSVRLVLFQAVRELLVNVVKHSGAHACRVSIRRTDDRLQVAVTDDGTGPVSEEVVRRGSAEPGGAGPPNGGKRAGGFGLFNIRERLARLGGTLAIRALPGKGTDVILTAPLKSVGN